MPSTRSEPPRQRTVRAPGSGGGDTAARPGLRTGSPAGRQRTVLVTVLVVLAVLAGRLVQVQGFQGEALAAEAFEGRLLTVAIPGDRGDIVDANGVVLATSVERYDIVLNQPLLADARRTTDGISEAAAQLAPLVGISAPELGARLIGTDPYVKLVRGVAPEVYHQVMDLRIPGITGERTTDRVYPAGTTAGSLVGFVGGEGFGQAGIEQVYDDALAGDEGSETYERGARGQRIPTGEQDSVPAVPGQDVRLTIDRDLQYVAQSALDAQIRKTGAAWGAVEVRDVRTGAILVLADSGSVDPNDPGGADAGQRGSRAVSAVYEPGSTAKVITMAAVLDAGLADPLTQMTVPYTYEVANGQSFKDSHEHPVLNLTLTGVLAESSNTGTVMVGQNLPPQVRHDYLTKFGFGTPTGVGLPGESGGIVHDAEDWDGRTEFAVLFGQGVGVTTLQATQVFATLANGGVRVQPHIVDALVDPDGTEHPVDLADPVQVVSPETAATLVTMLESAVAEGTGGNAAVPGYRVAGKTGTAQAFEGGGVVKNVASFIGIAPADDPRLVVNVVLYDPKTSIYGGDVAAPVFSQVTGHALRHLGIPPSGTRANLYPMTWQ